MKSPEFYSESSYPFGMLMPQRIFSSEDYRYGFNGMENDDEVKTDANGNPIKGSQQNFGARIYDPRIGRWLSVDPLVHKYPYQSPYSFALDNPILFKDYDGRDIEIRNNGEVFVYTGNNTQYSGSNEFINQTVKALNHLIMYESESNAQYKVATKLANDATVKVNVTEVPISLHPSGVNSAEWNPKQGTYVTDAKTGLKGTQSPSGTLLHELGHQYDKVYPGILTEILPKYPSEEQIDDYLARDKASPYGLLEEGVITKIENPYYEYYGQPTRGSHDDDGFFEVVGDFTSNTECTTCGTISQGTEIEIEQYNPK